MPRICDYEGSLYRAEFWENQNRTYEDAVERIAMVKLLPPQGDKLLEIGAGFGRLVDLYKGYKQIVLMDYARTQLEEAKAYLGPDDRFVFVVADVYNLPFVDNLFDTLTMVRVMHHLADVPLALTEIHRVIAPESTAVIEHASKFHLKSLARWALRRQAWNPFDRTPLEFVDMNFDFHPAWIRQQFEAVGLHISNVRSLSYCRLDILKRLLPTSLLVAIDRWAQPTGNLWQLSPSLFLQAHPQKSNQPRATDFFCCPHCKSSKLSSKESPLQHRLLECQGCQYAWSVRDGIYDFKTPIYPENR